MIEPRLIFDCRQDLTEGPVWHDGLLYWVNITAGEFHRLDPETGRSEVKRLGGFLSCAVPCTDGRWLLARQKGFEFFDWDSGRSEPVCDLEPGLTQNRFNDGKADPRGRFWAGSMNMEGAGPTGALYSLDAGRNCRTEVTEIGCSNGLAWSPDQTLFYYADSPTQRIDVFDFDPETGSIKNRRALVQVRTGYPDGMTIDAQGNIWVAFWDGWAVCCYDGKSGAELARIEMPVPRPSSCAFGGEDFGTLYITSAIHGLDEEVWRKAPHSGGIFAATPGVRGTPAHQFRIR